MSRPVKHRYIISGDLVAETPIHVGGLEGNPATDMALSVDGSGELYIPGTSLAGPLRHWLIERFDKEHVEEFWGRIPKKGKEDDKGHASFVTIADAKIQLPEGNPTEIRDGVGIDREYGTAAEGIKFDREILPKGTRIPLRLTFECRGDQGGGRGELRAALEALGSGEIRLGAAKTRGLGKVKLDGAWRVEDFNLHSSAGILRLLERPEAGGGAGGGFEKLCGNAATPNLAAGRICIAINWRPLGPVMVRASAEGTGIDMMPLVTGDGTGGQAPVISGSSAKGALRQQSERILATLLDNPVADEATGRQRFIDQLARLPLIETLYGAVKKKDEKGSRSGRGALAIDDCLAKVSMPTAGWTTIAEEWSQKLDGGTAVASAAVDAVFNCLGRQGNGGLDTAVHVAIDRWTGGAADGALFTAAEPRWGWNELHIEIDVARLVPSDNEKAGNKDRVAPAAVALLLLTLKDMVDGLVPLGFGVNRGYGDIAVESVELKVEPGSDPPPWLSPLHELRNIRPEGRRAVFTKSDKIEKLDEAWKKYLEAWRPAAASREDGK